MVELLALDLRVIALSKGERSPGLETPGGFKNEQGWSLIRSSRLVKCLRVQLQNALLAIYGENTGGSTWMCITRWVMKQYKLLTSRSALHLVEIFSRGSSATGILPLLT